VGEHGSPYPRFQRALATGKLELIRPAALECPRLDLIDMARIVAVYRDQEPRNFPRACLRWLELFCADRATTVADVAMAADALLVMVDEPDEALDTLARLCGR
jgi:hypothetical protein